MTTPYYQDDLVTLYHGDCREITEWLAADVLVTDPPYGIGYDSGSRRATLAASIEGDGDHHLRDAALAAWGERPALVFGTWRIPRPRGTRARLIWDTKGALGMGDLTIPWKPSDQEIYVLGTGFVGFRDSNVLTCAPVQSMARNGRVHPHQKPLALLDRLLVKCPPGTIADPFAGSGSTLVAAKRLGRRAIGVEIEECYCEIAAKRLDQGVLAFADPPMPSSSPPATAPVGEAVAHAQPGMWTTITPWSATHEDLVDHFEQALTEAESTAPLTARRAAEVAAAAWERLAAHQQDVEEDL